MGAAAADGRRARQALALAVGEGSRAPDEAHARIRRPVGNLSDKERKELSKLVGKLDLKGTSRELVL